MIRTIALALFCTLVLSLLITRNFRAHAHGAHAAAAGLSRQHCPYGPQQPAQRAAWLAGWNINDD